MPYDVFLSHNSQDKPLVRAVCDWLRNHEVENPWLDEANLEPGDRLTEELGKAMEESLAAVVFIGPHGEGPWQGEEIDSLLNKAIKLSRQKDEFRIIPVLLPNADTSKLRWFLRTRLWVDLSKGVTDNDVELFRLRQAILGRAEEAAIPGDPNFNPYMGLAAFQFKDADFFFGRTRACHGLAAKLKEWRFACIVGPSGNGKSSLARAGLATDVAEKAFPGIRSLRRVTLVPGGNLLRAFVEQLAAGVPDADRPGRVAEAVERIDPKGAPSSAEQWASRLNDEFRAWFPEEQQRVLFVVDQFEEVFTQRGLLTATDAEREERIRKVLDCLALLATRGDERWHFVFALRSDFYQRCRISAAFWNLISTEHLSFPLDELDEEGWREAIKGPAARAGAYLEAGLVETMLKDVYRQRGSMPLLQLALHQLWRLRQGACLTHAAYKTLGGVANALQSRAETSLKHLQDKKREYHEIARNLFLRLTALGEGVSDSRRRVERTELAWEKTDPENIEQVLAELSNPDNRLLVADAQSVEVTHEVLIRECDTIRAWIESARKEIPILRRLTHTARRWDENGRDPIFLNAADPPRELKHWVNRTTLRLTTLEREYWQASRASRAKDHREKRAQRQALLRAEEARRKQAESLLELEEEKRKQAENLLHTERRSRRTLRWLATVTSILLVAAGILAWIAVINWSKADELQIALADGFGIQSWMMIASSQVSPPTRDLPSEFSARIDAFTARHPDLKEIAAKLRLSQAMLLLGKQELKLAEAAFDAVDIHDLRLKDDMALKRSQATLIWWFANSSSPIWTADVDTQAQHALEQLKKEQSQLGDSSDVRDYLAETRVWIGLSAATQSLSRERARELVEDAIDVYAQTFTPADLAVLSAGQELLSDPKASAPEIRRRLRAITVLRAARDLNKRDNLGAHPKSAAFDLRVNQ